MHKILEIKNLNVQFDQLKAVDNISISVNLPCMMAIVGPNGSGKSSFVKAILGITEKKGGTVLLDGENILEKLEEIAYIPQNDQFDLDFPISVKDVVAMGVLSSKNWWKSYSKSEKERINSALSQVNLLEIKDKRFGTLSGGQRQRVLIARALVQGAAFIFLDEPFVGVDAKNQKELFELLQSFPSKGISVMMVHHDLSEIAQYFKEILLINKEQIAFGSVGEVLHAANVAKAFGSFEYIAS